MESSFPSPQIHGISVTRFPKTGNTWLKALTFVTVTRSRCSPLRPMIPFLEYDLAENPNNRDSAIPLVSTHVPYCFLPESIISSACKIISICRDAKDAFDSEPLPLEDAFDLFCNGLANYGPYWDHVLGYWRASLVSPEKTLFLTYEERKKDTTAYVKKLAEFMGCSLTLEEEEVQKIMKMCGFEKLRNLDVNKNGVSRKDTPSAIQAWESISKSVTAWRHLGVLEHFYKDVLWKICHISQCYAAINCELEQ